ncbi:MAG: family 16 glycosylhydrolase [Flavobacteriales bacterium]
MVRKVVILGLLALCKLEVKAQKPFLVMFHEQTVSISENVFIDEFTSDKLNDSLWYGHYPWGGLSLDAKTYTDPLMVKQRSGQLYLTVDTTSEWRTFPSWMIDTVKWKATHQGKMDGKVEIKRLTSAVWSKQKVKYGFFECRCWLPKGQGLWPAFWLYGGEPNEELDFMEAKGERKNAYHVDVHCPNRCDRIKKIGIFDQPFGHWVNVRKGVLGSWVIFSGLWTPHGVLFYFNNTLTASHQATFNTEMNVIANMSLAMDGGPFSPGPNKKTPFPTPFKIDYIRTWNIPEAALSLGIPLLKQSFLLTCVPLENEQMVFEKVGQYKPGDRVFIEYQEKPLMELDLTKEKQYIDTHYWKKGAYTLRAIRGLHTVQTTLIEKH